MKKMIRLISLLVILGLCVSFGGCKALDELRDSRGTITADGAIQLRDGTKYLRLPECQELAPDFGAGQMVYIVEEELPLLLTEFAEQYTPKSNDGQFLESLTGETAVYYCRSDIYDSILARINKGFVGEEYGYYYYDYELEDYAIYTLTPEQTKAVEQVCATQEGHILPEAATLNYDTIANLYLCSQDQLFKRYVADICMTDGKYYVVTDDNTVYDVPQDLSGVFEDIMEKQMEDYFYIYE